MGDGLSLPELAVIIVMAGAIQIVLGLAGVGRYVSYMPHIVLTGFMSGIGVLLLYTQVEKLFQLGTSDVALAALCLAVFFNMAGPYRQIHPRAAGRGRDWLDCCALHTRNPATGPCPGGTADSSVPRPLRCPALREVIRFGALPATGADRTDRRAAAGSRSVHE